MNSKVLASNSDLQSLFYPVFRLIITLSSYLNSLKKLFYWCIVDLQCVHICYTENWFNYTHTHTHMYILSFLCSLPLWLIKRYWIWFPVLYSRNLFILPMHNGLHLLIPNSQSTPPPPPPLWQPQVCSLCLWICFCFIDTFICVTF